MHLAPDGFRIRLMEPGEAEALRSLAVASGLVGPDVPDTADFVRWLLRHEIFVATADMGGPVGFAAARDAMDLYWLSGLAVDPAFRGLGLRKALLAAVVARAGWFFHRAVGLAVRDDEAADWYRRRRFLAVDRRDWTKGIADLASEVPGRPLEPPHVLEGEASKPVLVGTERTIMIYWM